MTNNERTNERRKKLKEAGLCIFCSTPVVDRVTCKKCSNRTYELSKKRGGNIKRMEHYYKNRDRLKAENLERYYKRKYGGQYQIVLERDGFSCTKCGKSHHLTIHHIDGNGYFSKTPNNSLDNLTTLCTSCHGYLHRSIQTFEKHQGKPITCSECNKPKKLWNKKNWCCRSCYTKNHMYLTV